MYRVLFSSSIFISSLLASMLDYERACLFSQVAVKEEESRQRYFSPKLDDGCDLAGG